VEDLIVGGCERSWGGSISVGASIGKKTRREWMEGNKGGNPPSSGTLRKYFTTLRGQPKKEKEHF